MWKFKLGLIGLCVGVLLFQSSCKTDIEVIAPKKDVTIIYGLLEADKSRHYIRINKGFVDEKPADELAGIQGINEYSDSELDARIIELTQSGEPTGAIWTLTPTFINNKLEGTFASDSNKVYYFDADLNIDRLYRIECDVNIEGEEPKLVYAETPIIGSNTEISLEKPRRAVTNEEERLEVSFIGNGAYRNESTVEWTKVPGGVTYNSYYRFYYWEVDTVSGERRKDSLTYAIGNKTYRPADAQSTGVVNFVINPEEFYAQIDRNIEDYDYDNDRFVRYVSDTLQYFLEVADNNLATYIRVNTPPTEVLQERPEYTNVVNGVGIFSSRLIITTRSSDPQISGRVLDRQTLTELVYSNVIVDLEESYRTSEKGFVSNRCRYNNQTEKFECR